MHDELLLLFKAGRTPLAALRAATINLERFFAATDSVGAAVGTVADLVPTKVRPVMQTATCTIAVYSMRSLPRLLARPQLRAAVNREVT